MQNLTNENADPYTPCRLEADVATIILLPITGIHQADKKMPLCCSLCCECCESLLQVSLFSHAVLARAINL